ncbi:phytoene/squalene synthase family protein [Azohydromonas sediminis]|uniref:phytoene/squalene synthase family protein n=1 Tax=Azohydromonas sediminis TaxID=2259674 RepID=UPI0013C2D084|nr:phytoene/squalene synthase family protein [Azohydromonas sediminis]
MSDAMAPQVSPIDLAACRELMRGGSRSFFAASLLLPRAVREPACALYAFCRIADDEIDASGGSPHALEALRLRLDAVYRLAPTPHPADRALAAVVHRYHIPRALPEALLEGFAWDAQGRRYETFDDVCDYAARVAGAVGAMMALLMGVRGAEPLARACDLGVAMQLSNIARDVREDAAMGRLYLPCAWLRDDGLDPDAWLADPQPHPAIERAVLRLLAQADALYRRVDGGVARLPLPCRPGINAARRLYAAIGHEVRRRGPQAWHSRAVVPASRKAWLLAQAVVQLWPRGAGTAPPLPANRHLVHAAASAPPPLDDRPAVLDRTAWVIDLFDRLERQERARYPLRRPVRAS